MTSPEAPARKTAAPPMATRLKQIGRILLRNWYWFALSLGLALGVAALRIFRQVPVYQRSAAIMIKLSGGDVSDKTLQELGVPKVSTNLTNELLLMRSNVVAEQVVRRLDLDVDYTQDGRFYPITAYGLSLPIKLRFCDLADNENARLRALLKEDGTLELDGWNKEGQSLPGPGVQVHLGDTAVTPLGRIATAPSPYYREGQTCDLKVSRTGIYAASERVRWLINPTLRDQNSTIIDITYKDVSLNRADDILNTLLTVYNEQWMLERNKQIVSTNDFIRERLAVIEQELGSVDQSISSFKSENLILDVQQAGSMAVAEASESSRMVSELDTKISQVRSVYEYMSALQDDGQQIPLYSTIENGVILQKILEYNSLILQRNNHQAFSSAQNPLVVDLNKQLASQRASIISSLSNEITTLQTLQTDLQAARSQAISKVARNPQQANYLLSVERQQKVKESLYLFLLQKREENELSQAFTAYNTQVIAPAHGNWKPVEPVPGNIYLLAILLGLGIPAVIIFLRQFLTTTVQGREDVKTMRIPFAGEIPQTKTDRKQPGRVVVSGNSRDLVNESFRVVRSNLEFLLGYESVHKVIMLTSMDPGSGKTFITANLSTVVGLKGKRVLAIDLDLRRGSLSAYAGRPHKGISGYLSGKYDDYRPLIVRMGEVDVLPCGALPPNPSELLYSERFSQLIATVREEYDYVFLDCPPVEMVADPAIIGRYADLTLFVARARLLEKSLLPEIDQWYMDKKFNNLVLLLNGTDGKTGRYGYHRYGYHYYGYGGAGK